MTLIQTLTNDMKQALKARDSQRLAAIRFLLAEIKNAQIDKGEALTDAEVEKIIARQIKQIKEAIDQFQAGDRDDLVQAEQVKLEVLSAYLPKQLSDRELEAIIDQVIKQLGPEAKFGQVMGAVMKQVAGRADGNRVKQMVTQRLAGG